MAVMILTYEVRPEDGEVEFLQLKDVAQNTIKQFHKSVNIIKVEDVEMGFGLKAVSINFSVDESCGSEAIEEKLKEQEEVGDVIVKSMSRAMG